MIKACGGYAENNGGGGRYCGGRVEERVRAVRVIILW